MSDPSSSFWKSLAIFLLLLLLGVYILYEWYDDQLYAQLAERDALIEQTRQDVKEAESRRLKSEEGESAVREQIADLKQKHAEEKARLEAQIAAGEQAKAKLEKAIADVKDMDAAQIAAEQQRFNDQAIERDQLAARLETVEASYEEAKKHAAELEEDLSKVNQAIADAAAEHQAKITALERHLNERVELARTTPMDENLLRTAQEVGVLPVVEAFEAQCKNADGELKESRAELEAMKASNAAMEQQLAEAQTELKVVQAQLDEAKVAAEAATAAAASDVADDGKSAEEMAALQAQLAAESEVREALQLQHQAAVTALEETLGDTKAQLASAKEQLAELKAAPPAAVTEEAPSSAAQAAGEDAQAQVAALQNSLEQERAEAEQAQSSLRDEIAALKTQLVDVQAQLQETRVDLAGAEQGSSAELEATKARIGELEDELEVARRAADEARELKVELQSMRELEAGFAALNGTYTDRGLLLRLAESELRFLPGQATLPAGDLQSLDRIADLMGKEAKLSIRIEGHTDSVGSDELNLDLSEQRAQAVQQALSERGVAADRIKAEGVGSARPIATNATAEGRSKNRRVEVYIID